MNNTQLDSFETALLFELRREVAEHSSAAVSSPARRRVAEPRRRVRFAALGVAGAAATVAAVFTLGGTGGSPAYAVSEDADGDVTVTMHRLDEAEVDGLEQALRDQGLDADVSFDTDGLDSVMDGGPLPGFEPGRAPDADAVDPSQEPDADQEPDVDPGQEPDSDPVDPGQEPDAEPVDPGQEPDADPVDPGQEPDAEPSMVLDGGGLSLLDVVVLGSLAEFPAASPEWEARMAELAAPCEFTEDWAALTQQGEDWVLHIPADSPLQDQSFEIGVDADGAMAVAYRVLYDGTHELICGHYDAGQGTPPQQ